MKYRAKPVLVKACRVEHRVKTDPEGKARRLCQALGLAFDAILRDLGLERIEGVRLKSGVFVEVAGCGGDYQLAAQGDWIVLMPSNTPYVKVLSNQEFNLLFAPADAILSLDGCANSEAILRRWRGLRSEGKAMTPKPCAICGEPATVRQMNGSGAARHLWRRDLPDEAAEVYDKIEKLRRNISDSSVPGRLN